MERFKQRMGFIKLRDPSAHSLRSFGRDDNNNQWKINYNIILK
jgi:hypothetical protein